MLYFKTMTSAVRPAHPEELDSIYLMGFDVWSEGKSEIDYLNECRTSPKYKKGTWFVLEEDGHLFSALIIYKFSEDTFGIGSLATPKLFRKRGYASCLISAVLKQIEQHRPDGRIFLYSDIKPEFYEKFGFALLPDVAQRYH